ncbi:MAG: DMT family transporter [Pseudomonadota bacterium]
MAISAYSIFAFTDVAIKKTTQVYDAFEVALYMNIFTILFLIPAIFFCGGIEKTTATKTLKFHALRCFCMMVNFVCLIYAFSQLPIASVYVIVFCAPFIVNILALLLLKENISAHRWLSITLGFLGVVIAMRPGQTEIGLAIILVVIGTFTYALSIISVRFIDKNDHWLSYLIYLMAFQTPILVGIVLYRGGTILPDLSDWQTMPWFLGAGFLYVIALSLLPAAIQRAGASIVAGLVYIVFPWGVFYGYTIFGDVVDHWTLAGASVIVLSGITLIYKEKQEKEDHERIG